VVTAANIAAAIATVRIIFIALPPQEL